MQADFWDAEGSWASSQIQVHTKMFIQAIVSDKWETSGEHKYAEIIFCSSNKEVLHCQYVQSGKTMITASGILGIGGFVHPCYKCPLRMENFSTLLFGHENNLKQRSSSMQFLMWGGDGS